MNKKNVILKFMSLFAKEADATIVEDEIIENKFVDVISGEKLLRADDIAVGVAIQEVVEEEMVDLEDGNYTLESGVTLVIAAGIIVEIIEAEEEVIEEVIEEANDFTDEEIDLIFKDIAEMLSNFKAMELKFSALAEDNTNLKNKVEELEKAPSVASIASNFSDDTMKNLTYIERFVKNKKK